MTRAGGITQTEDITWAAGIIRAEDLTRGLTSIRDTVLGVPRHDSVKAEGEESATGPSIQDYGCKRISGILKRYTPKVSDGQLDVTRPRRKFYA